MKTYAICPISDKRINKRVARFMLILLYFYWFFSA